MSSGTHIPHPSAFVSPTLASALRDTAREAEELGDLHAGQWEIFFKNGWLDTLVAREYGGKELPLPQVLKLEEGISWADGSAGWIATLCSGAGWFSGFMDPEIARIVCHTPRACIAGSGAATGTAERKEDGYEVRGYWNYASGALHATAFTANCMIVEDGNPVMTAEGEPVIRPFVFHRDEVIIHRTWHAMGMVATGSHAFEVTRRLCPFDRCFEVDTAAPRINRALYRYPFDQLAQQTLAVNLSGMAIRFLDLARELATLKSRQPLEQVTEVAVQKMVRARDMFYEVAAHVWEQCERGVPVPSRVLTKASDVSLTLTRAAREAVHIVFPFCGLTAADTRQEVNRVWRNFLTAGQHAIFQSLSEHAQ